MARSTKPRRADFYPDDWLAGTLELTLEEEDHRDVNDGFGQTAQIVKVLPALPCLLEVG